MTSASIDMAQLSGSETEQDTDDTESGSEVARPRGNTFGGVMPMPMASSRSVRVDSLISQTLQVEDEGDKHRYKRICGCWWSGNTRVLFCTASLFGGITMAQYAAAKIANSDALLADCVSMAVDAFTYAMNIGVEIAEVKCNKAHRPAQLMVPLVSISLLTYFTISVIQESVPNLKNYDSGEEVNPWIVLGFAVAGIVFDVVSIWLFARNAKKSAGGLGINMMAAFLHVGADLARSSTTLVESILIMAFGFNGTVTDAWACMIVSAIILVGAACALVEWILDARNGCSASAA